MKKSIIFLMASLAVGFTACDDTSDLGVEQKNPQEEIMSADGLTIEYGEADAGTTLNINNYANAVLWNPELGGTPVDQEAPLINVVSAENLPEGATVSFMMQMADDENFSNPQEINLTDGKALGSALGNAYQEIWGKTPLEHPVYIRFAAFVNSGKQVSRLGGLDRWYGQKQISVIPVDIQLEVQNSYAINLYEGGIKTVTDAMKHSEKHAYDDPNFSYTLEVSSAQVANGLTWDITGEDGTVYYPGADGKLVTDGERAKIINPGTYRIEANMLDLTYSIGLAFELISLPGNGQGWDPASKVWALATTDYTNYVGYAWLDGEFKFAAGSWDINWGKGAKDGVLAPGGGNIKVEETGLYYVTFNLQELTYTLTKVETIGAIGGFNDWGAQSNLEVSDNGRTIKGTVTFLADKNLEWKFRVNDNWDISLGGSLTDLQPGGSNLIAPAAGTYEISLQIAEHPYTCTLTAK